MIDLCDTHKIVRLLSCHYTIIRKKNEFYSTIQLQFHLRLKTVVVNGYMQELHLCIWTYNFDIKTISYLRHYCKSKQMFSVVDLSLCGVLFNYSFNVRSIQHFVCQKNLEI